MSGRLAALSRLALVFLTRCCCSWRRGPPLAMNPWDSVLNRIDSDLLGAHLLRRFPGGDAAAWAWCFLDDGGFADGARKRELGLLWSLALC